MCTLKNLISASSLFVYYATRCSQTEIYFFSTYWVQYLTNYHTPPNPVPSNPTPYPSTCCSTARAEKRIISSAISYTAPG